MTTIETTYSQARGSLKSLLDRVANDRDVVTIRRRNGDAVAMIAADELAGLQETAHLLRSPANASRLLSALTRSQADTSAPMPIAVLDTMVDGDGHR
jgi:antitoxin YefM